MNESIRVAMLIHGYHPRVGGAERQLGAVAPLLRAQGVDVHILSRRHPGLSPFERVDGVPVYRLPIPGPKVTASLSFTLAALLLLRRLHPHVVHAHEMFSPATTAVAARRLFGLPVVVTAHRSGHLGDAQRLQKKLFGAHRSAALQQYVDTFVTISREIDAELDAMGVPTRRRVAIPNGVDTERFVPLSATSKRMARAWLGLPPDAPIVIFTGRLAPEKRVCHLLSIWPAVRAQYPEALLLVLGTGEEEAALKQMAGPGVQLAGVIEDVAPYMQSADLFVLPSIAEGLSVAMLEAMACGLPAVVTQVGGAADVIEHGRNGWLIPPDDVPALQNAVLTLLGDTGLRAGLGREGRAGALRDYALPVVAARLRRLYEQLAAEKAASSWRTAVTAARRLKEWR